MVRFVVSLPDVAQSGAVLLQQAVDGINPEPATVVILLSQDDLYYCTIVVLNLTTDLIVSADEPGVLVNKVRVFQQRQQFLRIN